MFKSFALSLAFLGLVLIACQPPNLPKPVPQNLPPQPVTDVTGVAAQTSITLSWVNPSDTDLKYIDIMRTGAPTWRVSKASTSLKIAGLTPGLSYTFVLVALDTAGESSAPVDFTISTLPSGGLTPVADVTSAAVLAGNGQLTLTWTDPVSAAFKDVLIQSAGRSDVVVAAGVKQAVITGLPNGVPVSFKLTARGNQGQTSPGVTVSGTPVFSFGPQAPILLSVVTDSTGANLSWTYTVPTIDLVGLDLVVGSNPAQTFLVGNDATRLNFTGTVTIKLTVKAKNGAVSAVLTQSITAQANQTGTLSVTASLSIPSAAAVDFSAGGLPLTSAVKLSKVAGTSVTVATGFTGATSQTWYVDGVADGTGTTKVLTAAGLSLGLHTVTLVVVKAGVNYSGSFKLSVEN